MGRFLHHARFSVSSSPQISMPLHSKDSGRNNLDDDSYATADSSTAMPKYKMPEQEHGPRHAYSAVHDELMLDGNSR
jgi:glutamate decarboxylase